MARKSWVQINGKLIPKEELHLHEEGPKGPMVMGDIEPFVSPITKEVIRGRNHLRQHMKQHGVTHFQDYSPEYLEKRVKERIERATGQDRESRRDRIEHIKRAMER